jgi:hypothetical protein
MLALCVFTENRNLRVQVVALTNRKGFHMAEAQNSRKYTSNIFYTYSNSDALALAMASSHKKDVYLSMYIYTLYISAY